MKSLLFFNLRASLEVLFPKTPDSLNILTPGIHLRLFCNKTTMILLIFRKNSRRLQRGKTVYCSYIWFYDHHKIFHRRNYSLLSVPVMSFAPSLMWFSNRGRHFRRLSLTLFKEWTELLIYELEDIEIDYKSIKWPELKIYIKYIALYKTEGNIIFIYIYIFFSLKKKHI